MADRMMTYVLHVVVPALAVPLHVLDVGKNAAPSARGARGGVMARMSEERLLEIAEHWGGPDSPITGAADVADLLAEVRRAREEAATARRQALEEALTKVTAAKQEALDCDDPRDWLAVRPSP